MDLSLLEIVASVLTVITTAIIVAQWILHRRERRHHLADMDGIYNLASGAYDHLEKARKDRERRDEFVFGVRQVIQDIRKDCQNRIRELADRMPLRSYPNQCIEIGKADDSATKEVERKKTGEILEDERQEQKELKQERRERAE